MAESLSKTVTDALLARIARGEFEAGDRLPTELDLMAEYGVGRNTVREAMQALRTLGLVDVRPRLGARLLETTVENALATSAVSALLHERAIDELYDVRLVLEPAAAERAAQHRTEEDLEAIRRALTHFRVAYETGANVWEADLEFHQAVAQASGNRVMASILAPAADLLAAARKATGTVSVAVDRALREHEAIAEAIADRSAEQARAAMTTHIESAIWAVGLLRERDGS